MKEKDSNVEQSPTAKTSRRSFLKGSVAVATGGLAATAVPGSSGTSYWFRSED